MTQKERELLLAYLENESVRIELELVEAQARFRYRRIDVVDCFEVAALIVRRDTFLEFKRCVYALLNLLECV